MVLLSVAILGTAARFSSRQNRLHLTIHHGLQFGRMLCEHSGQIDSHTQQGLCSLLAVMLNWFSLKLECGPMPNVMVTLPNIGGALCSTPQSLAGAYYLTAVQ